MLDVESSQLDIPGSPGLWLSVSELANGKNVTRQAISLRVKRLSRDGLIQTKPGKGREVLVNAAEFDRVTNQTTDLVRATNGGAKPAAPPVGSDKTYDLVLGREQAKKTAYQAELARLDLEARLGTIVQVEEINAALATVAEALARGIDQLAAQAEDCATAVGRAGLPGAREFLRAAGRTLRGNLARALSDIKLSAARPTDEKPQD